MQCTDPELDLLCHGLLKQLRHMDSVERVLGVHDAQAKGLRRLMGGMREVSPW